jgi:hypothetical protein
LKKERETQAKNGGQIPIILKKKWGSDSNYFKNGGQIPINLAGFFSASDTRFQQNFEFMYHENSCKPRPC